MRRAAAFDLKRDEKVREPSLDMVSELIRGWGSRLRRSVSWVEVIAVDEEEDDEDGAKGGSSVCSDFDMLVY